MAKIFGNLWTKGLGILGAFTPGNAVVTDANGNLVDGGTPPGGAPSLVDYFEGPNGLIMGEWGTDYSAWTPPTPTVASQSIRFEANRLQSPAITLMEDGGEIEIVLGIETPGAYDAGVAHYTLREGSNRVAVFIRSSDRRLKVDLYNSTPTIVWSAVSTTVLAAGTKYRIGISYSDGVRGQIFIDGVEETLFSETDNGGNINFSLHGPYALGGIPWTDANYLKGKIGPFWLKNSSSDLNSTWANYYTGGDWVDAANGAVLRHKWDDYIDDANGLTWSVQGTGTPTLEDWADSIPTATNEFSTSGTTLLGPDSNPIKLMGYRIGVDTVAAGLVNATNLQWMDDQGVGGNCHGVEIWWSRGSPDGPHERYPNQIGIYNTSAMSAYIDAMRAIALSGKYIIPSIRVSFDGPAATQYLSTGTTGWEGWAPHQYVLYNQADQFGGNGRDRFFAWLDWLIPQILAVPEIVDKIAYWEMWHFPGHRHPLTNADWDQYFDTFLPAMIAKYRSHIPTALLGLSLNHQNAMTRLLARDDTIADPGVSNLVYVIGGYGDVNVLMTDGRLNSFPEDCWGPRYTGSTFEFLTYQASNPVCFHSQEGPGLYYTFRDGIEDGTAMTINQKAMLEGMFELLAETTNGWGFHGYNPFTGMQLGHPFNAILQNAFNDALDGLWP